MTADTISRETLRPATIVTPAKRRPWPSAPGASRGVIAPDGEGSSADDLDSSSGPSPEILQASRRAWPDRALLLVVSVAVILGAFWPTLLSYGSVWARYTYSHGYLTAAVALFLLWRRRGVLLGGRPYWAIGIVLSGFSLAWMAATVMNVQVVYQGLLPLILLAWVATITGPSGARRILPGVVVFFFAVPFWEIFIPPLQALTIKVSGGVTGALGIATTIRGEFITIPAGTFHVEDACAGLAYFIVGVLIATLYAHLFLERWRTRVEVVMLGAAIAIVGNWARVTGVILIGHWSQMQSPIVYHHGAFGWAIFAVGFLLGFFPLAHRLGKRERADGLRETAGEPVPASAPGRGSARSWEIILATALALLGPLVYFGVGVLPTASAATHPLPDPPSAWRELPSSQPRPYAWSPSFQDPDVFQTEGWTNGSVVVYRDRLLYEKEQQGRELIGGGNRIAPPADLLIDGSRWIRSDGLSVRQAAVADPDRRVVLVWYWYRVGGVRAVSPGWAKLLELWAFIRRRQTSEVVAVSTLCVTDDCTEGVGALRAFLGLD